MFFLYEYSYRIPVGVYDTRDNAYKALDYFLKHSSGCRFYVIYQGV
jgi:hypothetical protein